MASFLEKQARDYDKLADSIGKTADSVERLTGALLRPLGSGGGGGGKSRTTSPGTDIQGVTSFDRTLRNNLLDNPAPSPGGGQAGGGAGGSGGGLVSRQAQITLQGILTEIRGLRKDAAPGPSPGSRMRSF